MRHIIETGTDGATLCFFDPAALPADFDQRLADDPVSAFEELQKEGRFWCTALTATELTCSIFIWTRRCRKKSRSIRATRSRWRGSSCLAGPFGRAARS